MVIPTKEESLRRGERFSITWLIMVDTGSISMLPTTFVMADA
jgi:hypothetical protein